LLAVAPNESKAQDFSINFGGPPGYYDGGYFDPGYGYYYYHRRVYYRPNYYPGNLFPQGSGTKQTWTTALANQLETWALNRDSRVAIAGFHHWYPK
jgi:hypothetical protein